VTANGTKPCVLVVDDEAPLRELIVVTLGAGFECRQAVDGDEALRLVRERIPDVVLLDLMLPGRSGLEVLDEMRADELLRDVPVVVISAWQTEEDVQGALQRGASGFLPKPFEPEALVDVVTGLVRRA
jgi:two-component system phosphate regulon response regulator PhoB